MLPDNGNLFLSSLDDDLSSTTFGYVNVLRAFSRMIKRVVFLTIKNVPRAFIHMKTMNQVNVYLIK
jgi:hypothetical protein